MTTRVRTFELGLDGTPLVHGPGWIGENNCYIHGYEPIPDQFYIRCFECGHVYITAEDLRAAYRQIVEAMALQPPRWLNTLVVPLDPLVVPPGEEIFFCQECTHDF